MKVYIITQHEHEDSCTFGTDFKTEGYLSKVVATERLARLKEDLGKHSGLYYTLDEVNVNTKRH